MISAPHTLSRRRSPYSSLWALVLSTLGTIGSVGAQSLPPVVSLRVEFRSPLEFAAVSSIRASRGGHILVSDAIARRIILVDSTLRLQRVIVDTAISATLRCTSRICGLTGFRGDTSLFIDPTSLAMLVMDSRGNVIRTIALPQPRDAGTTIGGLYGQPGLDARGRIVFREAERVGLPVQDAAGHWTMPTFPDTVSLVRYDFTERRLDTLAMLRIPRVERRLMPVASGGRQLVTVTNPLASSDIWAVLENGTVVVIRGQDYRPELLNSDGTWLKAPRIGHPWRHLDESEKRAYIDSTQAALDRLRARAAAPSAVELVAAAELPDYAPPFAEGAAIADRDGRLWVRTSTVVDGASIYDVISSEGALVARFRPPTGRVVAGFGSDGIVFLAVRDGAAVRLERARISR